MTPVKKVPPSKLNIPCTIFFTPVKASPTNFKMFSSNHFENLSLFLEEDIIELEFKAKKLPKEIISEAKRLYVL